MLLKVCLLSAMQCARNHDKYKDRVKMGSDPGFHVLRGHGISRVECDRAQRKKTREGMLAETIATKALR